MSKQWFSKAPGPSLSPRSPRRKTSKSCSADDVDVLSVRVGSAPSGLDTATLSTISFSFSALAFSCSAAFNFASSLYFFSYLIIARKKYGTAELEEATKEHWNSEPENDAKTILVEQFYVCISNLRSIMHTFKVILKPKFSHFKAFFYQMHTHAQVKWD